MPEDEVEEEDEECRDDQGEDEDDDDDVTDGNETVAFADKDNDDE